MKIVVNESDRMSWQWKQCTHEKSCSTTDNQGEGTTRPVVLLWLPTRKLARVWKKKAKLFTFVGLNPDTEKVSNIHHPSPIPLHFWVLLKLIGIALRWFSSGMGGPPSRWPPPHFSLISPDLVDLLTSLTLSFCLDCWAWRCLWLCHQPLSGDRPLNVASFCCYFVLFFFFFLSSSFSFSLFGFLFLLSS